jgi:anti-sigma-K factor RskA
MTCDELRQDYELYAMGVLDDPERSEIREHLNRGCDVCTAGVRDASGAVYAFAASVEGPEPPRRLRRKVLATVAPEPTTRAWDWRSAWLTAAICALAAIAVFLNIDRRNTMETVSLERRLDRQTAQMASYREALDILNAPETREVNFGGGKPEPPRGRVFVNPNGVLLIASRLPPPPEGKTYEMWVVPKKGAPAPAGLFGSTPDGRAVHFQRGAVSVADAAAIAVTVEAQGGAPAPTSQPFIVAPLGD